MSDDNESLVVIATHGPEDAERSTLAFVMANAAMAMDVDCKVILQAGGVFLAQKGVAEHVRAPSLAPLADLMKSYAEQGGKLYVCTPCCQARNLTKDDLLENCEFVTSGFVIDEVLKAKSCMNY